MMFANFLPEYHNKLVFWFPFVTLSYQFTLSLIARVTFLKTPISSAVLLLLNPVVTPH